MTPVTEDETERLELFTHSDAAREAVAHVHKIEQLTGTNRPTRPRRRLKSGAAEAESLAPAVS